MAEPSTIDFQCPTCTAIISVPRRSSGTKIACKDCGQRLQVPGRPFVNKTIIGDLIPPAKLQEPPLPLAAHADEVDVTLVNEREVLPSKGPMSIHRIIIIVFAAAGMLSVFMPWVSMPPLSINGMHGNVGWIAAVLFVPALVVALAIGNRSKYLSRQERSIAAIPACLAIVIGGFKIKEVYDSNHSLEFVGIGLFVLVAAGAGLAFIAWVIDEHST